MMEGDDFFELDMAQQVMTEGEGAEMGYAAYNNFYGGYDAFNDYHQQQQQQYNPVDYGYNYDQNEANLTYANLEASQMQSQNLDVPEDHYEEDEEDPDDEVIRAAQAVDPAPRRPQQAAAPSSPMSYYEAEQPCTRRKILGVYEKKPKVKKEEKPDGRKKKCPRLHQCLQVGLLSGLAFMNSGRDACSLREIYAFIVENFEGFDIRVEAWKKSIRHSLCTHTQIYTKAPGDGNWMFRNKQLYQEKLYMYLQKNRDVTTYGLKDPSRWGQIAAGTRGIPQVVTREDQKTEQERNRRRKAENGHRMSSKRRRDSIAGYGAEQMLTNGTAGQDMEEHMEVWQNMMLKYQQMGYHPGYVPQYAYQYYNGYPAQMVANYNEEYLKQQQQLQQQQDPSLAAYYNYYNGGGGAVQQDQEPGQDYLVPNSAESQYLAESPDLLPAPEAGGLEYQEQQQL